MEILDLPVSSTVGVHLSLVTQCRSCQRKDIFSVAKLGYCNFVLLQDMYPALILTDVFLMTHY